MRRRRCHRRAHWRVEGGCNDDSESPCFSQGVGRASSKSHGLCRGSPFPTSGDAAGGAIAFRHTRYRTKKRACWEAMAAVGVPTLRVRSGAASTSGGYCSGEFRNCLLNLAHRHSPVYSPADCISSGVNCAICRSIGRTPSAVSTKLSGFASTTTVASAGRYHPKYDFGASLNPCSCMKSEICSVVGGRSSG